MNKQELYQIAFSIDVKENKIIGYKSVEINGFGVLEEILKAIFLFR